MTLPTPYLSRKARENLRWCLRGLVAREVKEERERQIKKWGEQNHDDYRWLAILTEEVGELAQAILHNEFGGHASGMAKTELVQVAAVAIQWLECMQRQCGNEKKIGAMR